MSSRVPCHEYIKCRFEPGSLGFEIRRTDPDSDPILGNAIIAKVVQGGQAEREQVAVYDCIVNVNGEYVPFLTFEAITEKLRSASRPLIVVFARPWKSAWERIGKDIDGTIKVGAMEKLSVNSFLSRWQQREFVLTRTTLSYNEDGVLKRKIPLEEIVQLLPLPQETEFAFQHQGREFRLKCEDSDDRMMWMHAIETAKKGCFDNTGTVVSKLSAISVSGGGGASQTAPPVPKKGLPPVPPISRGPYHYLNKSLVVVKVDNDLGDLDVTMPPPVMIPRFPPIDLSLERQILGSS